MLGLVVVVVIVVWEGNGRRCAKWIDIIHYKYTPKVTIK